CRFSTSETRSLFQRSSGVELRVPRHLPQVSVRILEVTCVPAPESLFRGFDDRCARVPRLLHDRVDLCLRLDIVSQGEVRGARRRSGDAAVVGEVIAMPESEFQPRLEIEEDDSAMFVLLANDALCLPAQSIAIEVESTLEVVHA